jgi:hypothetical protein
MRGGLIVKKTKMVNSRFWVSAIALPRWKNVKPLKRPWNVSMECQIGIRFSAGSPSSDEKPTVVMCRASLPIK